MRLCGNSQKAMSLAFPSRSRRSTSDNTSWRTPVVAELGFDGGGVEALDCELR